MDCGGIHCGVKANFSHWCVVLYIVTLSALLVAVVMSPKEVMGLGLPLGASATPDRLHSVGVFAGREHGTAHLGRKLFLLGFSLVWRD
jgi:hypothetical protein